MSEVATELAQKKAEIAKLLDEFEACLTRANECQLEASRLMDAFRENVVDTAGMSAALELFQRLVRIAEKFQRLKIGGDPSGPV